MSDEDVLISPYGVDLVVQSCSLIGQAVRRTETGNDFRAEEEVLIKPVFHAVPCLCAGQNSVLENHILDSPELVDTCTAAGRSSRSEAARIGRSGGWRRLSGVTSGGPRGVVCRVVVPAHIRELNGACGRAVGSWYRNDKLLGNPGRAGGCVGPSCAATRWHRGRDIGVCWV